MPFLRARLCIVIETIQIIKEVLEEKSFSVKEIFKVRMAYYCLLTVEKLTIPETAEVLRIENSEVKQRYDTLIERIRTAYSNYGK